MFQLGEAADHRSRSQAPSKLSLKQLGLATLAFGCVMVVLYMSRAAQTGGMTADYAMQERYMHYSAATETYDFIVVADMDLASKMEGTQKWKSELRHGRLMRNGRTGGYSIRMQEEARAPAGLCW